MPPCLFPFDRQVHRYALTKLPSMIQCCPNVLANPHRYCYIQKEHKEKEQKILYLNQFFIAFLLTYTF